MYERMLDKQSQPDMESFFAYCGKTRELLEHLNEFMTSYEKVQTGLRFPYGNSYGWAIHYVMGSKHICDVFAEKDAFTVMIRLTNAQFDSLYDDLLPYTKEIIDHKYPCGSGGWIHYRVLEKEQLEDIQRLLQVKL